jgi:hypothetical protein
VGVGTVVGRIGCEAKRSGTNGGPKKQKRKEGNTEGDTMGSPVATASLQMNGINMAEALDCE